MRPNSVTILMSAILLAAVSSSLHGQVDSALAFFPLTTGDLHQYEYHYSYWAGDPCSVHSYSSFHMEQVLGDTLLPTGFQYRIVTSSVPGDPSPRFLRVDSATANVYMYDSYPSPREYIVDSLRATEGSWFIRYGLFMTECFSVDTATVLGVLTLVKRFRVDYIWGEVYALAYGLGRIQDVTYSKDPCYPVLDNHIRDIVYARIDTLEYGMLVSVRENNEAIPTSVELAQNYPNPFNGETTFEFSIPREERVRLRILNVLGQEITTILDDNVSAGKHRIRWTAQHLASGIYYYRLETNSQFTARKLLMVK